jgi:hypothetical protein
LSEGDIRRLRSLGDSLNARRGRDEWHFVYMTLECGHAYQFDLDGMTGTRTAGATPT